jgi:very-short-patch-repair endonuclease
MSPPNPPHASPGRFPDDSRLKIAPLPLDQAIAALARRQHGVVSIAQLAALGVDQRAVSHRVTAGRLHRIHRGVYAVGHTVLTIRGRWTAAVLAAGPGAALSHASAAALWDLRRSAATIVDISVPSRAGRVKRRGLRIHRPRTLRPSEVATHDGISVTTPARTILDLAATLQRHRLERLLDQAEIQELTDYPSLDAIARAHPGHPGSKRLQRALASYEAGGTLKRSDLERVFLKICDEHGLPTPEVNRRVQGEEVDFLFEDERLIVEADSWRFHKTRQAFERDRRRDATHLEAGYRTLRFTDRRIARRPDEVARAVAAALNPSATVPNSRPRDPEARSLRMPAWP